MNGWICRIHVSVLQRLMNVKFIKVIVIMLVSWSWSIIIRKPPGKKNHERRAVSLDRKCMLVIIRFSF